MSNNDDWKKIQEYIDSKEAETKKKYKVNIYRNPSEDLNRFRKITKLTKAIFIITICVVFINLIYSIFEFEIQMRRINYVKEFSGMEVEEISVKTYMFGKGFYSYRTKSIPEIEIHALYLSKSEFKEDSVDRIHKYFFENWEDSEKYKFVIKESYEDCEYSFTKKTDWLLNYETYIEVNSYEEMLEATESIIRFIRYIGNSNILIKTYIKVENEMICPYNSSIQSDKEIRETAKMQYLKIIEKNDK